MKDKIIQFLLDNNYELQEDNDNPTYVQDNINGRGVNYAISIEEKELVACDCVGNTIILPMDIYALIGFLIQWSEIGVGYNDTVFHKDKQ